MRARLALLVGGLLAEGGLLAARFDALPLRDRSSAWWAVALAQTGFLLPLATSVITAGVLLGGSQSWHLGPDAVALGRPRRRTVALVVAHLLAFVLLFRLTAAVFEEGGSGFAAVAWVLTTCTLVGTAAAAALPRGAVAACGRHAAAALLSAAVIGSIAWRLGQVTAAWWQPLSRSTLGLVQAILRLFTREPVVDPAVSLIGTPSFQVTIAPKCSGYEGIGLITVFLGAYFWTFRRTLRFPHAFLLLPLGMLAMWLANGTRIAALIGLGTLVSPELAVGGFHANSGSLLLCGVALGIGWAARRSPFFAIVDAPQATSTNPTAAYLAPLVVGVAVSMATGAVARDPFDPLYGVRVIAVLATLWAYRRHYPRGEGWSWGALGIGAIVFVLWMALEPAPTAASPVGRALSAAPAGWAAAWLAFRVSGAVITVPLAEELAFRGYLGRRLVARDFERVPLRRFSWLGFLASSLAFGALHQRFVAGTIAGMLYAVAVYRRGTLADAVIAHATTNALLAGYVLVTGSWSLWQ
jgi:exosortase E/protease (VPEID-CTERM system)